MACMNDYVSVKLKCSYEPCGYEDTATVNKHEQFNVQTRHCPKCNLFTLKPVPLYEQWGLDRNPAFMEAMRKIKEEGDE